MKKNYLIALALVLLLLLTTNPANALQASASINMSAPTIILTDLASGDNITPGFILSNKTSNVGWSWSSQQVLGDGGYFTKLIDYYPDYNNPASSWMIDRSVTHTSLIGGATSSAALTRSSSGTTTVTGYDDGYALWGSFSYSAVFTLTGNTQVDIWIPVDLTVDPTGSDPAAGGGVGPEAYARTILQLSSLTYQMLAWDSLWRDHWTSGSLTGNLHVTFKNEFDSDYSGAMDVNAYGVTMSYGASTTVPEPASIFLLGLGLMGLAGVRRFKN